MCQLGTAHRQQGLVARHDGLAASQRGLDQLVGGVEAADELDDHVDVVALDQPGGVGTNQRAVDDGGAGLVRVGDRDAHQLQADAGTGGDVVDRA